MFLSPLCLLLWLRLDSLQMLPVWFLLLLLPLIDWFAFEVGAGAVGVVQRVGLDLQQVLV